SAAVRFLHRPRGPSALSTQLGPIRKRYGSRWNLLTLDLGPSTLDPVRMNYLAHGWRFAAEPYVLAGTAAPDWLSVIDRKTRLRSRTAAQFVDDADPVLAAVARGVVQHHA